MLNVFFGAGNIGKRMLEIWKLRNLEVDFFVDNNIELIGEKIDGVEVVSLDRILRLSEEVTYYITSQYVDSMINQLLSYGVSADAIKKVEPITELLKELCSLEELHKIFSVTKSEHVFDKKKVVFELSYGLVLGGSEVWAIDSMNKLEEMGYNTTFLVDGDKEEIDVNKSKVVISNYNESSTDIEKINQILNALVEIGAHTIVCNHIHYNFMAACILKKMYPKSIRLIAVMHSDDLAYYNNYENMKEYIDVIFSISNRIKDSLISRNIPQKKIVSLPWKINTEDNLIREYSSEVDPIRIGYAGRLTTTYKRVDYVIAVAKELKRRQIRFVMEFAGNGHYEEAIKKDIKELHMENCVKLVGLIAPDKMREFWVKQDIMISCSDVEGHSITQCEAMAAGAVPVMTDTSGVRDDVMDGENGFVLEIGAVKQIVEKIIYLYENRNLLPIMGRKAYEVIKYKYNEAEVEGLWKQILG